MKIYFLYLFLFLQSSLNSCAQKTDKPVIFDFDPSYNPPKTNIEKMPEFPGGVVAMKKYINENTYYPDIAKKEGIQGKCFVKFKVEADGSISNISVLKGVSNCAECDIEAIRVVKSMPNWKPGIVDKQPKPLWYNLPVIFKNK